jgi:hypothetical protein
LILSAVGVLILEPLSGAALLAQAGALSRADRGHETPRQPRGRADGSAC